MLLRMTFDRVGRRSREAERLRDAIALLVLQGRKTHAMVIPGTVSGLAGLLLSPTAPWLVRYLPSPRVGKPPLCSFHISSVQLLFSYLIFSIFQPFTPSLHLTSLHLVLFLLSRFGWGLTVTVLPIPAARHERDLWQASAFAQPDRVGDGEE